MKLYSLQTSHSTATGRSLFFIFIAVLFYLLYRYGLFISDDYMYAYIFGTETRISSLSDIFTSQCRHYMQFNGRFIVHCIVQLFCGILGMEWFHVFQTIMFVLFVALTTRLVCKTWQAPIVWYAITATAIWFLIPRINLTLLGNISCGVNYLWVGVATAMFMLLYRRLAHSTNHSLIVKIGAGLFGLVCGSLQESFSIPIAGALFIYYCFNFRKLRDAAAWLVIGYWLGTIILIVAPANFVRLSKEISEDNTISRTIQLFSSCMLITAFLLAHLPVLSKRFGRKFIVGFVSDYWMHYTMILISILFTIFIAYTGRHQMFFAGWLIIILAIDCLRRILGSAIDRYGRMICIVLAIAVLPVYIHAYHAKKLVFNLQQKIVSDIVESDDGNIIVNGYSAYVLKDYIALRYADFWGLLAGGGKPSLSLYYTGDTEHIRNFIPCAPERLPELLDSNHRVSDNVYLLTDPCCYVIETAPDVPVTIEVECPIKGIRSIVRRLQGRSVSTIFTFDDTNPVHNKLTYMDRRYLFIYDNDSDILSVRLVKP